ncbi:response regulator transcription factor [Paenibacillus psychroresistens]|uniref:response regulator transcription factor n=1 Tax=Paenibacillus psychroresistens TaxID=1778678 RepID=UPI001391D4DD|nr:helix-turn-helix transcriptional regulator [Paenibacillus psychroresistens]
MSFGSPRNEGNSILATIQRHDKLSEFIHRHKLTSRESEIFCLIALKGYTNMQIADYCVISDKTVKNHIVKIMNKVGSRSIRKVLSNLILDLLTLPSSETV